MNQPLEKHERETVLRVLSAASFLIMFQSYLVAPLVPALMSEFAASQNIVGLLVPAYLLPYGVSTLFYGPLSDRAGRKTLLLLLLGAMVLATAGTATAQTVTQLLVWRLATGIATGGVIPIALALLSDLYNYHERGHPIGWIFGAIAGGMAFGSTLGALLNPYVGWRFVFLGIAALQLLNFLWAVLHRKTLEGTRHHHPPGIAATFHGYLSLLKNARGRRTYFYIFCNGLFHSGVFTWLGYYFARRYKLSEAGIGLALLGYGVPGLLFAPTIGRAADRLGRRFLIPIGLLLGGAAGALLIWHLPLWGAALVCTALSLGFDMSHPLLVGIITSLDRARHGQSMGLNAFVLFMGFGLGSLVFQALLRGDNFLPPLAIFAGVQLILGILGCWIFRKEEAGGVVKTS